MDISRKHISFMIKFDEITEYVVLNNFMKGVAFLPNSKSQTEEDSFEYIHKKIIYYTSMFIL